MSFLSYLSGKLHAMIGRLYTTVIDTPDPRALAAFYAELLGGRITRTDDDWVDVTHGGGKLSFQLAPDLRPPRWPDPEQPQQVHLDVEVDDVHAAERRVLELGARRLPGEGGDEKSGFRVYADPTGHPFCLVW